MNIENIKVGDIYKNYKALCEALEIKAKTSGDSKVSQLKEIERFVEYSKKGHSFVIEKLHINPIKESVKVGGSRDHLPFSNELEMLLIDLLLSNGNKMIKSNSSLLRDLCMINSNYYEYFSNKELLSSLLEMDLSHIADWYDATNASFKGHLQTLLRKLENKKMITHEIVVMVVFVETNIQTTPTGFAKASDLMEYDAERDIFIERSVKPTTTVREASDKEVKLILEIEGEILDEYECKSVQEVYLKGLIKKYYKELSKRLFSELNIKRSYKAHKIHINHNRLLKEQESSLEEFKLTSTKRIVNNGVQDRVLDNAKNRQQKSLLLNPFIRNPKQISRASESYLSNIGTLNHNLIDIHNVENLKVLKEAAKDKPVKQIEQEEFESYILDQLPFSEIN
ncbi:hypothetical protein [Bacillus sp. FJAT-22090]|uniref:hypothetical protein n=1 Tax=Bacillus sp. FJAT-22090 TaxID=1581038 RepID=UPI0011A1DDE8|nr:hypothetical protein [Bacillus sp. FJAT-22090]